MHGCGLLRPSPCASVGQKDWAQCILRDKLETSPLLFKRYSSTIHLPVFEGKASPFHRFLVVPIFSFLSVLRLYARCRVGGYSVVDVDTLVDVPIWCSMPFQLHPVSLLSAASSSSSHSIHQTPDPPIQAAKCHLWKRQEGPVKSVPWEGIPSRHRGRMLPWPCSSL